MYVIDLYVQKLIIFVSNILQYVENNCRLTLASIQIFIKKKISCEYEKNVI